MHYRAKENFIWIGLLADPSVQDLHSTGGAAILLTTGRILSLFCRRFRIVGRGNKFFRHGLRVVIIAAGLQRLVVLINRLGSIAFGIIGIAALNARPRANQGG